LRRLAETARSSAEEARSAADEARRHRDTVLRVVERLRRAAETGRAVAEQRRRTDADRFDTETRLAIREELEISAEMQKSANAFGEPGGASRGARKKESRKNR
jgi:hypothetical protein